MLKKCKKKKKVNKKKQKKTKKNMHLLCGLSIIYHWKAYPVA